MRKLMMAFCGILSAALPLAASVTVSTNVVPGEWTSDFAAAKAYADTNSVPLLVYWTNPGCVHCTRLETSVFEVEDFAVWQQDRKMVMVFSEGDAAVKAFARNDSGQYPFVAVYWNKGEGLETVLKKFTGRSGMMLWPLPSASLLDEFTNSVDLAINRTELPPLLIEDGVLTFVNLGDATDFVVPDGVTGIGSRVFRNCSSLTRVTIPVGVTDIGYAAFSGCTGLASVTIPSSVTDIGKSAFSGCSGLTDLVIPGGVTNIGDAAFSGCTGLASVTIPSSVTGIGESAFSGCSELADVSIIDGGSPVAIGLDAFAECPKLKRFVLPDLAYTPAYGWGEYPVHSDYIRATVFEGCSGMEEIVVSENNPHHSVRNGLLCDKEGTTVLFCPAGLKEVKIPDSVTHVRQGTFDDCDTSVFDTTAIPGVRLVDGWVVGVTDDLPSRLALDGIRGIADSAFEGCRLADLTISGKVESIGNYAFGWCENLTNVTISGKVESIGNYAFDGCENLTTIDMPDNVASIGSGAFEHCTGLADEQGFVIVRDVLYGYVGAGGVVRIPGGVREISSFAFAETGVTHVTIPPGVTDIGNDAFAWCGNLTTIDIPDSVVSIGHGAFADCCGLADEQGFVIVRDVLYGYVGAGGVVRIPGGVREISNSAFEGTEMTHVTIPSGVTRIGSCAFAGRDLTHVTVPDSVTEIGDFAFAGGSLTGAELPARFEGNLNDTVFASNPETLVVTYRAEAVDAPIQPVVATNFVEVVVTNTVVATNFVDMAVVTTNLVNVTVTNTVTDHVTVTNMLEIAAEAGIVPAEIRTSTPEEGVTFEGMDKKKFNGVVFDADGTMRGVIQIETAKATAKGVKVKGFAMLEDGKKTALKAVTVPIETGRLAVETAVGKVGTLKVTVGGNGFKGSLEAMKVVSADIGEATGVLTGSLTLKYIDGEGKVKSRKIAVGGVTSEGTAAGTATPKGGAAKVFAAELE